jgi:hypothetical protein
VSAAGVVSRFPPRVNNWALADFHDAVTGAESHIGGCASDLYVRPLISVVVYVVGDLAEKNTFRS